MKKIILGLLILSFQFNSFAADELNIVSKENHDVRLLKTIKLAEGKYVYLTARDEGHVLGQRFLVQTRVSCQGDSKDFSSLPIVDSHSVCNMKPDSVKMNKSMTAIAMLSKSANINKYYEDIASGKSEPQVDCNTKTEVLKFSLKNLCK